jgi:hypothetical protein
MNFDPNNFLLAPSIPPKARSREPFTGLDENGSNDDGGDKESHVPPVLDGCDKRLRMAFGRCVDDLAKELCQGKAIKDWTDLLSSERKATILDRVMQSVNQQYKLSKKKARPIRQEAELNLEAMARAILSHQNAKLTPRRNVELNTPEGRRAKLTEIYQKLENKADFYNILGISRSATQQDIQKSYRNLAKIVHSDKSGHLDEDAGRIMQGENLCMHTNQTEANLIQR